jgi:hypothetical protein
MLLLDNASAEAAVSIDARTRGPGVRPARTFFHPKTTRI